MFSCIFLIYVGDCSSRKSCWLKDNFIFVLHYGILIFLNWAYPFPFALNGNTIVPDITRKKEKRVVSSTHCQETHCARPPSKRALWGENLTAPTSSISLQNRTQKSNQLTLQQRRPLKAPRRRPYGILIDEAIQYIPPVVFIIVSIVLSMFNFLQNCIHSKRYKSKVRIPEQL